MRRNVFSLLLVVAFVQTVYSGHSTTEQPLKILFVGNSLTYFYGTPYILAEYVQQAYGERIEAISLVQSGGRLSDAVRAGAVFDLLASTKFEYVVLQEQGGLLLCAADRAQRDNEVCTASLSAHQKIIESARLSNPNVKIILLGTIQRDAGVANALTFGEKWFGRKVHADYVVTVANRQVFGRSTHPLYDWVDGDGAHPNTTTNVLKSILLAQTIFGRKSSLETLALRTPIRIPNTEISYDSPLLGTKVFHGDEKMSVGGAEMQFLQCISESEYTACSM